MFSTCVNANDKSSCIRLAFQDGSVGHRETKRRPLGKSRLSQRQERKSVAGAKKVCSVVTTGNKFIRLACILGVPQNRWWWILAITLQNVNRMSTFLPMGIGEACSTFLLLDVNHLGLYYDIRRWRFLSNIGNKVPYLNRFYWYSMGTWITCVLKSRF